MCFVYEKRLPLLLIAEVIVHQDREVVHLNISEDIVWGHDAVDMLQRADWVFGIVLHLRLLGKFESAEGVNLLLLTEEEALTSDGRPELEIFLHFLISESPHHIDAAAFRHSIPEHQVRLVLALSLLVVDVLEEISQENCVLLVITTAKIQELLAS